MRRATVIATGALLSVLVAAGCTHGGGTSSVAGQKAPGGSVRAAGGGAVARSLPAESAGGTSSSSGKPADSTGDAAPVIDGTAQIRVAQMAVNVKKGGVGAAADKAETIAEAAGGEIDSDDRSSDGGGSATLTLRVPPENLTSVLRQLSALGHEVSRQLSTTDVTERVADVKSRVASAESSIARLRTLYATATKVADVIAIESELNSREADLESLQAQARALDRQTSLSTVTLALQTATPVVRPLKKSKTHTGFVGGLRRGWDGFVRLATGVATVVGALLPFALLALLVLGAGRLVWRRRPRRRPPTPAPVE